uniref:LRRC37A/B like protein 1 C-terminal domain-containing protein n=1 Tax=Strigops habroptila TaxID=2489341 RepID=A0A672V352_STRHB
MCSWCVTAPLAETPGYLMGPVAPRKGNSHSVLKLQTKEPLLREQRTITLAVVLSLSSPDALAPSPQQLSRQEGNTAKELMLMLQNIQHTGWSSSIDTRRFYFLAEGLVAQLKNKLHKAMSTLTVKSPSTARPLQRDEGQEVPAGEGGRGTGWEQREHLLDLTQAESTLWEAARRMNLSNILPVSGHQRAPTPLAAQPPPRYPTEAPHLARSGGSQDHSNAMEQTNAADWMKDEDSAEDEEEAESPTQDSAGTNEEQEQQDSDETVGSEGAEEEPAAAESRAEQRLSSIQHFFYTLLADNSPPAASSAPEDTAAAEHSSGGGQPLTARASSTTRGQDKEQEPPVPTAPGSSSAPGGAATRGAAFDTLLSRHLHSLVPDRALRRFMAHVARALRGDCGLPQLQPACAKMVSRTGLLLKLLSERQHDPEPSDLLEQCVREEDAGTSTPRAQVQAREMDSESAETEMAKHTSGQRLLLALSLSSLITFTLLVLCCSKVCTKKRAEDSQGSSDSRLKRCFQNLQPKCWSRNKDKDKDKDEEAALAQPDAGEEPDLDEVVVDRTDPRSRSSSPSADATSEDEPLSLAPQAP